MHLFAKLSQFENFSNDFRNLDLKMSYFEKGNFIVLKENKVFFNFQQAKNLRENCKKEAEKKQRKLDKMRGKITSGDSSEKNKNPAFLVKDTKLDFVEDFRKISQFCRDRENYFKFINEFK